MTALYEIQYQQFVESMAIHCHCKQSNRPCDGVLAGGICDNVQDEPERYNEDEYEED